MAKTKPAEPNQHRQALRPSEPFALDEAARDTHVGGYYAVFVGSWALGRDVPPNAMELGIYFGGVVFAAAAGKSGYEAVKRPRGPSDER